jgi:hypothetical protein
MRDIPLNEVNQLLKISYLRLKLLEYSFIIFLSCSLFDWSDWVCEVKILEVVVPTTGKCLMILFEFFKNLE